VYATELGNRPLDSWLDLRHLSQVHTYCDGVATRARSSAAVRSAVSTFTSGDRDPGTFVQQSSRNGAPDAWPRQ